MLLEQTEDALGFCRIGAGDLVGNVAVMAAVLAVVAQVLNQLQRGGQIDRRQLVGQRPPYVSFHVRRGEGLGRRLAFAQ